jgi:hypothetical protein
MSGRLPINLLVVDGCLRLAPLLACKNKLRQAEVHIDFMVWQMMQSLELALQACCMSCTASLLHIGLFVDCRLSLLDRELQRQQCHSGKLAC